MKGRALLVAWSAALAAATPATSQLVGTGRAGVSDTTSTIVTLGRGEVQVPPSRATVFIEISAEAHEAGAAARANDSIQSRVRTTLSGLGFGADEVAYWGLGAGQANPRVRFTPTQVGPPRTYETRSGLRVVVAPLDRLVAVVEAVLQAGAAGVPMVQFEAVDTDAAEREAARMAVEQARTSATAIAEAAGGRLGALRQIQVLPDYGGGVWTVGGRFTGSVPDQGVQLVPSDVTVRVQVQASWVFVPR